MIAVSFDPSLHGLSIYSTPDQNKEGFDELFPFMYTLERKMRRLVWHSWHCSCLSPYGRTTTASGQDGRVAGGFKGETGGTLSRIKEQGISKPETFY